MTTFDPHQSVRRRAAGTLLTFSRRHGAPPAFVRALEEIVSALDSDDWSRARARFQRMSFGTMCASDDWLPESTNNPEEDTYLYGLQEGAIANFVFTMGLTWPGDPASVAFPALAVAHDSVLAVSALQEECSARAWRRGYFKDLFYYDSNGMIWRVAHAAPVTEPSLVQRALNARLRIDLRLEAPEQASIDAIKSLLTEIIEEAPDDVYHQAVSHEELKAMIQRNVRIVDSPRCMIVAGTVTVRFASGLLSRSVS